MIDKVFINKANSFPNPNVNYHQIKLIQILMIFLAFNGLQSEDWRNSALEPAEMNEFKTGTNRKK
jgi:hypothetical protein